MAWLIAAALALTGCATDAMPSATPTNTYDGAAETPTVTQAQPTQTPPEEAAEEAGAPDTSVVEYGEIEAIIDNGEFMYTYLRYPKTGDEAIDKVIGDWARGLYEQTRGEVAELRASDAAAEGEVNVHFNSYLTDGGYAGIAELGFYTNSQMAHPIDVVQTFNVDIAAKKLIENAEILDSARQGEVLALLREKILARYPELTDLPDALDGQWLESIALRRGGLDVLLARGKFLPTYLGLQIFELSYEELGDAFILGAAPPVEETPTATPAPEITPLPITPPEVPPQSGDIDPAKPMVALTFDDGPHRTVTPRILDLLEQYGARATFCVIGNLVEGNSELPRRAVDLGCEVIGHSWDHKNLTKLSTEELQIELESTYEVIRAATGMTPAMFRPPYGSVNDHVKDVARDMGLAMINWSVDTRDWESRNAASVYDEVMASVKDRSIILCHDMYSSTADAMELVIPELLARGYQLVTVSELMSYSGKTIEPGKVYYNG
ncbi:MAG: polysaccharide deacetylase family protein [Oscillospiraceae bacterium]|nr:polysaccharide deacetylase family protein [Oscillospiraceae bacterium]